MISNIVVHASGNAAIFTEYLDFNQVPHSKIELWTNINGDQGYCIPADIKDSTNTLLVINYQTLLEFFSWDLGKADLTKFLLKNYLWVWGDVDGIVNLHIQVYPFLPEIQALNTANITFFTDGVLFDTYGFNTKVFPVNIFQRASRMSSGSNEKHNCKYDFLLTTVTKPEGRSGAPHRTILADLISKDEIFQRGLISVRSRNDRYNNWVGETPHDHKWFDGFPSMDLYRNCWFELVPETISNYGYFYTEKTNKAIVTKTPFLPVTSKGYLQYLSSIGFKTFGNIINETYDTVDNDADRVAAVLAQVKDIQLNGCSDFYHAAKDTLDYNYMHLCTLSGQWQHLMDDFITQCLHDAGVAI